MEQNYVEFYSPGTMVSESTQREIDSWLMVAGKPPAVVWWHGALLGFCPVVGQLTIPVAMLTWVAMFFI